jgi:2,3-bisphosphoglycerate-dependent phosphoglycerate mutase
MATLLLVRHGETDWNREHRFQGHADPPLNRTGREQARDLAEQLAEVPLSAVFASPLRRALDTAEAVAAPHDVRVVQEPGLREVDLGSWTGLTRAQVEQRDPEGYRRWLDYGHGWADGESYEALGERVVATLLAIAAGRDGATVAVVTHGGPIRASLAAAAGVPYGEARRTAPPIANCAVYRVSIARGTLTRLD